MCIRDSIGTVVDDVGTPVPQIGIRVSKDGTTGFFSVRAKNNGAFDIPVDAGTWRLQIDDLEVQIRGLDLFGVINTFTVVNGVNQTGITITLPLW